MICVLGGLRQIKKIVLWFIILCVIAGGGAIGYLKIYHISNVEMQLEFLGKPYISIPLIIVLIAFIVFIALKKKRKDHGKI
jgi:hypothetical protein